MTQKELIEILLYNIECMGIEMLEDRLDCHCCINPKRGIGAWDKEKATPFGIAHEMIHAKYHDESRCYGFDALNPAEKRANREAIAYLWDIFLAEGGSIGYIQNFIDFTDCPVDLSYSIIKKIESA